jgi:RNA polymerase sigma-70 factor (ECF subfamily)
MTPSLTLDHLYTEYSRLVSSIVRRSLAAHGFRDGATVEDISQSVWTECWQHLQSGGKATPAWLQLRAQSRSTDYLRSRSAHEISLEDLTAMEPDGDDGDRATPEIYTEAPITRSHRLKEAIAAQVDELSPMQRRALELVYYAGQTPQQAAAEMGISHAAIRQHLSRGVAALRSRMAANNQEAA